VHSGGFACLALSAWHWSGQYKRRSLLDIILHGGLTSSGNYAISSSCSDLTILSNTCLLCLALLLWYRTASCRGRPVWSFTDQASELQLAHVSRLVFCYHSHAPHSNVTTKVPRFAMLVPALLFCAVYTSPSSYLLSCNCPSHCVIQATCSRLTPNG
jgi:hypothetical protein